MSFLILHRSHAGAWERWYSSNGVIKLPGCYATLMDLTLDLAFWLIAFILWQVVAYLIPICFRCYKYMSRWPFGDIWSYCTEPYTDLIWFWLCFAQDRGTTELTEILCLSRCWFVTSERIFAREDFKFRCTYNAVRCERATLCFTTLRAMTINNAMDWTRDFESNASAKTATFVHFNNTPFHLLLNDRGQIIVFDNVISICSLTQFFNVSNLSGYYLVVSPNIKPTRDTEKSK